MLGYYNYLRQFAGLPNLHISNIFEINNALTALFLIIVVIITLPIFFYTLRRFVRPFFNQIYFLLIPNRCKVIFKSIYSNFVIFSKSKLFQGVTRLIVLVIFQTSIAECAPPMNSQQEISKGIDKVIDLLLEPNDLTLLTDFRPRPVVDLTHSTNIVDLTETGSDIATETPAEKTQPVIVISDDEEEQPLTKKTKIK